MYFTGYIEGWAKYADHFCVKYGKDADKTMVRIDMLNDDFAYIMWCMIDVGVNHYGWGIKETQEFMSTYYNVTFDDAEYYFNVVQENPTNMVQYYYSYFLIEDYKVDFFADNRKATDKLFHDSILELGAVPFPILKKHLQAVKDDMTKK